MAGKPENVCGFCGSVCSPGNNCHKCGVYNWSFVGEDAVRKGLSAVADQVEKTWRAEDYPNDVRSVSAQFRHAHVHAIKALGKIAAVIDHDEHEREDEEAFNAESEVPKLLADLVRCAAKMAEMRGISLADAYIKRAQQLAKRWGH